MNAELNWWRGRLLYLQPKVRERYRLEGGTLVPVDQPSPNAEREEAAPEARPNEASAGEECPVLEQVPPTTARPLSVEECIAELLASSPKTDEKAADATFKARAPAVLEAQHGKQESAHELAAYTIFEAFSRPVTEAECPLDKMEFPDASSPEAREKAKRTQEWFAKGDMDAPF